MDVLLTTLFSGLIAGVVVVVVEHLVLWRYKRTLDLKRHVFDEAVAAISMRQTDALDHELQGDNKAAAGVKPVTALRSETKIRMASAQALVPAVFNKATADAFEKLLSTKIDLSNIPNTEYFDQLVVVMPMLAKEMDPPSWWYWWYR